MPPRRKWPIGVGDTVVRVIDVGSRTRFTDMEGQVLSVHPKQRPIGGSWFKYKVRWSNGYEGSVDERQVATCAEVCAKRR